MRIAIMCQIVVVSVFVFGQVFNASICDGSFAFPCVESRGEIGCELLVALIALISIISIIAIIAMAIGHPILHSIVVGQYLGLH